MALVISGTQRYQENLYQRQITYINQIVTRFNLLNGFTRLAAVTNGNVPRVMFNFIDGGVRTKKIQTLMTDLQNPGQPLNSKKVISTLLNDVFPVSNSARSKVQRSVIFFVTLNDDLAKVKENVRKIQDRSIDVTIVVIGDADKQRLSKVRNNLLPIVGDAMKIIFLDNESTDTIAEKVDDTVQLLSLSSKLLYLILKKISNTVYIYLLNFSKLCLRKFSNL